MIIGARERTLLIIIAVNSVVSLGYLIWGLILYPRHLLNLERNSQENDRLLAEKKEFYSKSNYLLKGLIMLICPIVGPFFFIIGEGLIFLIFRRSADLADVMFSKERVQAHVKPDEEAGQYIAPLEEAIAISDTSSLRTLMLNVVKGDIQHSLASISLALNSEDSETAHYAASVLRDELNDFRVNVQKLYAQVKQREEDMEECGIMLIEYMNSVLEQKVFSDREQDSLVRIMEEVCSILFENNPSIMTNLYMEWISLRLLEIQEYKLCEKWCLYSMEEHPDELSSYTCRLKLYYTTHDKEKFFTALDEVKNSSIVIDNETLELIRIFG